MRFRAVQIDKKTINSPTNKGGYSWNVTSRWHIPVRKCWRFYL